MKYADYKKEDLIFVKKDNWTKEEMKEFLDTCPENIHLTEILDELKKLSEAIDNGEVKKCRYSGLNKSSLKAYIKKNGTYLSYGKPSRCFSYSSDDNYAYVMIDGDPKYITSKYDPIDIINTYKDGGNIEHRFRILSNKYSKAERLWADSIERENYSAVNKERIKANSKLNSVIRSLDVSVPNLCEDNCYDYDNGGYYVHYSTGTVGFKGYDYGWNRNQYGEILVNNIPLSTNKANEIYDMTMEMSQKIKEIINEYKPKFDKAFNKEGR